MSNFRRLPPLLRALMVFSLVAALAALGVAAWAFLLLWGHGEPSQQLGPFSIALVELSLPFTQ